MNTYEKKYKEALEKARQLCAYPTSKPFISDLQDLFPELAESKDESIRKRLLAYFKSFTSEVFFNGVPTKDAVAWLEKQGSELNWCHHEVDLSNCSEKYRKAYYDGWNNCNMQHSQCNSERNDVIKCLINGMKFYYEDNEEATWGTDKWSMPVKHIIEVLEKQGEQKPVWNEEDETILKAIILNLEECSKTCAIPSKEYVLKCIIWLKSLKDRVQSQNSYNSYKRIKPITTV